MEEEDYYLPHDIIFSILSFVPPETLFSASRVAKEWNEIILKHNFWRKSCIGRYTSSKFEQKLTSPQQWRTLSKKYVQFESNFWKKKSKQMDIMGHSDEVLCISMNHIGLCASGGADSQLLIHKLNINYVINT